MPKGGRLDRVIVSAPGPGKCPVCGVQHREDEPHDTRSIYYQCRYWRKHKKLPGSPGKEVK